MRNLIYVLSFLNFFFIANGNEKISDTFGDLTYSSQEVQYGLKELKKSINLIENIKLNHEKLRSEAIDLVISENPKLEIEVRNKVERELFSWVIKDNIIMQSKLIPKGSIIIGLYGYKNGEKINLSILTSDYNELLIASGDKMAFQISLTEIADSEIQLQMVYRIEESKGEINSTFTLKPNEPLLLSYDYSDSYTDSLVNFSDYSVITHVHNWMFAWAYKF